MTETLIRPATFNVPAPEPAKYGLLDVATVHEGFTWLDPVGLFDTFNCLRPTSVDWTCPPTGGKTLTPSPSWVDGTRFFVYLPATCKAVGYEQAEAVTNLSRVFDNVESYAAEQRFQAAVLAGAPVVVAGTYTAQAALALIEQDAANKYAGTPTFHVSRAIASLLTQNGQIKDDGHGVLRTGLGSKVVAGGGYASNSVWATGEVTIITGDKMDQQVVNQSTNEVVTMIERAYVAAVDCYRAVVGLAPIATSP